MRVNLKLDIETEKEIAEFLSSVSDTRGRSIKVKEILIAGLALVKKNEDKGKKAPAKPACTHVKGIDGNKQPEPAIREDLLQKKEQDGQAEFFKGFEVKA